MKRSLTEFAKSNKQHHSGRCWMCNIPERDEVHALVKALAADTERNKKGVPFKTIFLWLRDECGYNGEATYAKVHMHFQNRHHERTA